MHAGASSSKVRAFPWSRWVASTPSVVLGSLLAGLIVTGCAGGGDKPTAKTEQVTIAMTGGVDKTPAKLDSRVADVIVWSNSSDEVVTIEFVRGGPTAFDVPAHGQSRAVSVSEFGGRGSYPYHIRRAGQSMNAPADSAGGPDEPTVDVGP